MGRRIERRQLEGSPLNGRNWAGLNRACAFVGGHQPQHQQLDVRLAIQLDTIDGFRAASMLASPKAGATPGWPNESNFTFWNQRVAWRRL